MYCESVVVAQRIVQRISKASRICTADRFVASNVKWEDPAVVVIGTEVVTYR